MASFVFLSLLTASALNAAFARPSFKYSTRPFPNITATFNINAECIPFEDPHCCVDAPVCECRNGTFFSMNPRRINGTYSLCGPPGNVTLGEDTSNIPGWCC
ncbi:hypothetical protein F4677DRAFT_195547 [Hypoxylon crocopeplum]|nr:hypothetical protein F4677DRAFT_195547 [Hypoxylon crocopeplum]